VDAPRPDGLTTKERERADTTDGVTATDGASASDGQDGITAADGRDGVTAADGAADGPVGTSADRPAQRETAAARARTLGRPLVRALTRFRVLPWLLAAALILVAAGVGFLGYRVHQENQANERSQDVLAAARQEALNFISIDYRNFAQDTNNVLSGATGDFKQQFTDQSKTLQSLVTSNKAVSTGQVLQAGMVTSSPTSARVLVVADAKVANTAAPSGQVRNYRLQMDLVEQNGQWLTSDIEFVG